MKFNSQICTTRSQSERLLALGLKKETADMVHQAIGVGPYKVWGNKEVEEDFFPAWSLHRLMEMMPRLIKMQGKECRLRLTTRTVEYAYPIPNEIEWPKWLSIVPEKDTCYDAIILCIEWLIKEGYFNKEYLEE